MQTQTHSNTPNQSATRFLQTQNVSRHAIVSLIDGEAVTTTLAIAIGCNVDHASVIKLVRAYQADLEEFGLLDFKSESTGGRPTEIALLNEQQSTLIMTYMRNSPIVREFKKTLVKEFWLLVRGKPVALPSYAETLRLYADQIEQTQLVTLERDHAVATKAEIGSRREATAMATASTAKKLANKLLAELGRNAEFATITAVENATDEKLGKQAFRPLRTYCNEHGPAPMNVADARYGSVKAWPAIAWKQTYGIDLAEVFGGEA